MKKMSKSEAGLVIGGYRDPRGALNIARRITCYSYHNASIFDRYGVTWGEATFKERLITDVHLRAENLWYKSNC